MNEAKSSFSRAEHIRKRREFLEAYRRGHRFLGANHVYYFLENGLPYSRLGITASRKTGSAVVRNRIKRRLREVFRVNKKAIWPPCDLVVNAKRRAGAVSTESIRLELLKTFRYWNRSGERSRKNGPA